MNKKTLMKKEKRKIRTRYHLKKVSDLMRLSVYRSGSHIYAQLIDDCKGITLASASSLDKELPKDLKGKNNISVAQWVGETISKRIVSLGIKKIKFDRGPYAFSGKVKALGDAIRSFELLS